MWPITCLAQSLFSFSRGTLKINNYVVNPSPLSLEMWQASEWTNHIQILHTAHTCFNLKPTDWPWIKFNCFCWLFLKFLHDESHLTVQAMARHRITASEGSHSSNVSVRRREQNHLASIQYSRDMLFARAEGPAMMSRIILTHIKFH